MPTSPGLIYSLEISHYIFFFALIYKFNNEYLTNTYKMFMSLTAVSSMLNFMSKLNDKT